MATPGRILPTRAAKSLARGVIFSRILQDHPRSTGQNREGSDAHPTASAPSSARAQSREATDRPRRGRPMKVSKRNVQNLHSNFPNPDVYSDPEISQLNDSAPK